MIKAKRQKRVQQDYARYATGMAKREARADRSTPVVEHQRDLAQVEILDEWCVRSDASRRPRVKSAALARTVCDYPGIRALCAFGSAGYRDADGGT
jgi:hypothetical protein